MLSNTIYDEFDDLDWGDLGSEMGEQSGKLSPVLVDTVGFVDSMDLLSSDLTAVKDDQLSPTDSFSCSSNFSDEIIVDNDPLLIHAITPQIQSSFSEIQSATNRPTINSHQSVHATTPKHPLVVILRQNTIATNGGTVSPMCISNEQGKCMTKNAVSARENRLKKKQHLNVLQKDATTNALENQRLKKRVAAMEMTITSLTEEVEYLRSVLANESSLAMLLKNIPHISGLKFNNCPSTTNNCVSDLSMNKNESPDNINGKRLLRSCKSTKKGLHDKRAFNGEVNNNCGSNLSKGMDVLKDEEIPNVNDRIKHSFKRKIETQESCFQKQRKNQKYAVHTRSEKSAHTDHDYTKQSQSDFSIVSRTEDSYINSNDNQHDVKAAGVCLHVSDKVVSLQFCSKCNSNAVQSMENN